MPLKAYVENGVLYVEESTTGSIPAPEDVVLIECAIPGCDVRLPEGEFEDHLFFHDDPVEEEPETLSADADDEGVYSVTSLDEGPGSDGSESEPESMQ